MSQPAAIAKTGAPQPVSVLAPKPLLPARGRFLLKKCACGGSGGDCEECRKKKLQRRAANSAAPAPRGIPSIVHDVLNAPGRPLDAGTRAYMEPRFGHDFSRVRIHDNARAAESARAVGAHAYTVGDDIAFAHGKYAPNSREGRHLLAHELAHTVQQRGLQRSAATEFPSSGEEQRLEAAADHAADAVMSGGSTPAIAAAATAVLSRSRDWTVSKENRTVRRGRDVGVEGNDRARRRINQLDRDYDVDRVQFGPDTPQNGRPASVAFRVTPFYLPRSKGDVISQYNDVLAAGALRAIYSVDGTASAPVLHQSRAPSGPSANPMTPNNPNQNLRETWLMSRGWPTACSNQLWQAAGGDAVFPHVQIAPGVPRSCQVDHIIELQVGGHNGGSNLQMLDRDPNLESGVAIDRQLELLARGLVREFEADFAPDWPPREVTLEFTSIQRVGSGSVNPCSAAPATGPANACWQVDCRSRSIAATAATCGAAASTSGNSASVPGATPTLTPYPVTAGGQNASFRVPARASTPVGVALGPTLPGQTAALPVAEGATENRIASELVAGLVMTRINLTPAGKPPADTIDAEVDVRSFGGADRRAQTAVPIPLRRGPQSFKLAVDDPGGRGQLRFANRGSRRLEFVYPFLSPVSMDVSLDANGGLMGKGKLTPTLPILSKAPLNVELSEKRFRAFYGTAQKDLKTPIPGLVITEASLGTELLPEFKPVGRLSLRLGPAERPLATATMEAFADEHGLAFKGDLEAFIPGVKAATGKVSYSNKTWSGGVTIEAGQLQERFKRVRSGSLTVGFDDKGLSAAGTVGIDLPHSEDVTLGLHYSRGGWIFKGGGTFKPPRLGPVKIGLTYDGKKLIGDVKSGPQFTLLGFTGKIETLHYEDEKISGSGSLTFKKGKAAGRLDVKLSKEGRFSGKGSLTYALTENLIANATAELDEKEKLRLTGEIRYNKPVELFRKYEASKPIFDVSLSIPIPGLSLGPIGVKATIGGSLSAAAGIGPGEIRNIVVEAAFNPLEDNPDAMVKAGATLHIPAYAQITGAVRAEINLDALLARVGAGLKVSLTARLEGAFDTKLSLQFSKGRFAAEAQFELMLALLLAVALDAYIHAEAGVSIFSVEKRKEWNLAGVKIDSGAKMGLRFPVRYASDEPFKFPSLSDIEFIKPQLNFERLLKNAVEAAKTKETES